MSVHFLGNLSAGVWDLVMVDSSGHASGKVKTLSKGFSFPKLSQPESQLPASPCFGERLVKQEQPNPNKRTSTQQAPQAPKPRLECVSRNPHPTREATKPHIQLL